MNVLGLLESDLHRSPLGLASHQADLVGGVPLLRRTAERCLRSREVSQWIAVCEADDAEAVGRMLAGLPIEVVAVSGLRRAADAYPIRARKWATHTWRGGLQGITWLDELAHGPGVHLAAGRAADAVVFVHGSAALVDPAWTDAAVRHHVETWDRVMLTFSQAAPGLVPPVFRTQLLLDVLSARGSMADLFRFNPDDPALDLTGKDCCLVTPIAMNTCPYRFSADSGAWAEFLAAAIGGVGEDASAEAAVAWAHANPQAAVGTLPREVEVEITSETNLPADEVHFPSARGGRGRMSVERFADLARQLAARDDALLAVGGFGEPLTHPQWPGMLAAARRAGVWGISLRTNAVALDEAAAERLLECDADVLEVLLDADTAATYAKRKGADAFDRVVGNLDRFLALRARSGRRFPVLVPRMAKMPETMGEIESFYHRWIRADRMAVLDGYNDFAGQRPDRGVVNMCPPGRGACRRVFSRLLVLADGSAAVCEQDASDKYPIGRLGEAGVAEIWGEPTLAKLRAAHVAGRWDAYPLCPACREWHRP